MGSKCPIVGEQRVSAPGGEAFDEVIFNCKSVMPSCGFAQDTLARCRNARECAAAKRALEACERDRAQAVTEVWVGCGDHSAILHDYVSCVEGGGRVNACLRPLRKFLRCAVHATESGN
mmetsp:Transcript_19495/g.42127  ORF Transcript_19495/g.42127 Transcript_19495/m.42127 type:complete len:119 (-) Transcript_19495:39-395(-)